jgi:large repetitive protein
VGETWTFLADYAVTADDVAAGAVDNEATATALGPNGQMPTSAAHWDQLLA